MPFPPKKLAAFANGGDDGPKKGGGKPPFPPKKGKGGGGDGGGGNGGPPQKNAHHDEPEHADIDIEAIAERIEDGDGDKRLMKLSKGIDPDETPQWAHDADMWEEAKEMVDPEGDGAQYDEPWAVVAHVYQALGGQVEGGGGGGKQHGGDDHEDDDHEDHGGDHEDEPDFA